MRQNPLGIDNFFKKELPTPLFFPTSVFFFYFLNFNKTVGYLLPKGNLFIKQELRVG